MSHPAVVPAFVPKHLARAAFGWPLLLIGPCNVSGFPARVVAMAVKLHRCSAMWVKIDGHPCWRVQKALDEQGVEYEVVKGPLRPGKRDELDQLSGQRKYPVIEFEDGRSYRAESAEMAEKIRAGDLFSSPGQAGPAA